MAETKLYMDAAYLAKWQKALQSPKIIDAEPQIRVVPNAILLPLRKRKDFTNLHDGIHEGGVCDSQLNFLAGVRRNRKDPLINYSCQRSYVPQEQIVQKNTTVLFGGVLYAPFGHFLCDSLSYIWAFLKNPAIDCKVAFLMMTGQKFRYQKIFDLIGLTEDRIEFIDQPTQFASVLLPDEVMFSIECSAYREYLLFFDAIKQNVLSNFPKPEFNQIYLTRTQFTKHDCINEEYYEDFYRSLGYQIIAPEKHPFVEQVAIIANADKIACTIGTLSHLCVFAKDGVELDCLCRTPTEIVRPQLIINQLKNVQCNFIQASQEILPVKHSWGIFFYLPTEYFVTYCQDHNYLYQDNREEIIKQVLYDYLIKYTLNYTNSKKFKTIKEYDFIDIMIYLNKFFLHRNIKREDLTSNENVNQENKRLEAENKLLWQQRTVTSTTNLTLDAHFSMIGWLFNLQNASEILQKHSLEALKINSTTEIIYKVYQDKYGWQEQNSHTGIYCGKVGKSAKIQTVILQLKNPETQSCSISYRVFIAKKGWTEFCSNGQKCGNLTVDSPDYTPLAILGIQIILSNKILPKD